MTLRIVYAPRGRALEYAPLAYSAYRWCGYRCGYCFVPEMSNAEEHGVPYPRNNAITLLEKDCAELEAAGDTREILMSFTTDPYQFINEKYGLTRQAITIFHKYNRPYSVLTKGGIRSMQDFDLMEQRPDLARYATTLTCMTKESMLKWEHRAPPWWERFEALREAHRKGIRTWGSFEPIVDPAETQYLIAETLPYLDLYRIGVMNHQDPGFDKSRLYDFVKSIKFILEWHQKEYVFKKDILPYVLEQRDHGN